MTNANTMQARRKLRNLCPCQNLRASAGGACTVDTLFVSLHWSLNSGSPKTTTLLAVEVHISHILRKEETIQFIHFQITGIHKQRALHLKKNVRSKVVILTFSFTIEGNKSR